MLTRNFFTRSGLKAGERFLIHSGSSGIGTTAIQLAKAFGARVFVTAGSDEKYAACLALDAETAIDYKDQDFVTVMKAQGGADLILDMVGGDYIPRNIKTLANDGRLVQIAFLQGAGPELNFALMMMKRLTITGSTLRPQSDLAKTRIAQDLSEHVWPLIETGKVAPVMDSTFDLAQAADAAHSHGKQRAYWKDRAEGCSRLIISNVGHDRVRSFHRLANLDACRTVSSVLEIIV